MHNQWLRNKSFIQWCLFPLEEDLLYWDDFIKNNPDVRDEITEAKQFLKSIKLNVKKLTPEEKQNIFDLIQTDLNKRRKKKRIYRSISIMSAAGILIFFILSKFNLFDIGVDKQIGDIKIIEESLNQKDVQLILANSETYTFEGDAHIKYDEQGEISVNSGDERLKIKHSRRENQEQNMLIVPKGKRSSLILPDGTKAWINSGTTLKYPVQFSNTKREIWANGEIYIEVAKKEKQPFLIHTSRMTIEVIGTQFNIMAYPEDSEQSVVLVEGSVHVKTDDDDEIDLLPNQKLTITGNSLSTKKVDISEYISWKEGYLIFSSEPLSQIMTRLSRYYDIRIESEGDISGMKCTGKLVLFDDVEEVLKTIYNTTPVTYEINDKNIILKKRE